tara:strand:- start:389 stop:661 length:273 start_codon:yes stop_codon:yes gene_type:complete
MNKFLRLTVHVTDVQKVDASTGKRIKNASGKFINETKRKIFNTLSFMVKDQDEVNRKLAEVRKWYTIALGQDPNKKDKYGKELINISFVK